jgi:hypothetical protein
VRFGIVALILLVAAAVYAQAGLPIRDFGVIWARGAPKVSFAAKDLADARVREALSGGLRKRLVVTVGSHLRSSNWQMAVREFSCDVTRDLWEDGYLVRIGTRSERFKTLEEVLDRCLMVEGLFAGERKNFEPHRGKEIYFVVQAEFNPISKKQCRELVRPTSGGDPIGPITVNIVRRRICQAERRVEFRSAYLKVPQ